MTSKEKSDVPERWYIRILRWRLTYVFMAVALLVLDYVTGDLIQFPIAFVIPVALASWFCSPRNGYRLAVIMPSVRFGFAFFWNSGMQAYAVINVIIRIAVLLFIAYLASKAARLTREVKLLQGIFLCAVSAKKSGTKTITGNQSKFTYPSARMRTSVTAFARNAQKFITENFSTQKIIDFNSI